MGLDEYPMKISQALVLSKKYYDADTYAHVLRVMQYVADNDMIPTEYREECVSLAIMHDLLEDTKFETFGLPSNFTKALELISMQKNMTYMDYIRNIKENTDSTWGKCTWWVKIADMKDHLSLTDTLTEQRKKKYLEALAYLL